MFGTTAEKHSTAVMGCQTRKTEKNGVNRHHGRSVLNPTVRGDLLQPVAKGFNHDDPLISPKLIFFELILFLAPFSPSKPP